MVDHSQMKLGMNPPRFDARTLRAVNYMLPGLPPAKPAVDWLKPVVKFPMYANNRYGDCAIAGIGHMVQVWSANVGTPVTPSEAEILRVYRLLSPDDQGCVLLDVLKYWRLNPICGIKLGAFAAVDLNDQNEIKVTLDLFGGLYGGALLPIAAQKQKVWEVVSGRKGEPGSWGGHCTSWGQYADGELRCVTWGQTKDATWAWLNKYAVELWALITPAWFGPEGKSPAGLDIERLKSDLEVIGGVPPEASDSELRWA